MRDVNRWIAEGQAACSERSDITGPEIKQLYAEAGGDMFTLIENTFFFGFAAGCRAANRKGKI